VIDSSIKRVTREWQDRIDSELSKVVSASPLPIQRHAITAIRSQLLASAIEPWMPSQAIDERIRRMAAKGQVRGGEDCAPIQIGHPEHGGWLESHTQARLESQVENLARAVRRAAVHLSDLPVRGAKSIAAIADLAVLGSETHNRGQQPVLIRFSPNQAVVYKPVNLQADQAVATALAGIQKRNRLKSLFSTLDYAAAGPDYGFIQYAKPGARLVSGAARRRFFFRFGALIAVAYALNITDMHMENVLAIGEHPLLIDLETAFYRFPEDIRPTDVRLTGLVEVTQNEGQRSSGLQGGGPCRQVALDYRTENSGMVVGYRQSTYHAGNRPTGSDGKLLDPKRYGSDILAGFDLAYRLAKKERGWLLSHVESLQPGMKIRHILRFTTYYLLHIYRLLQPSANSPEAQREQLLQRLSTDGFAASRIGKELASREVASLRRGDVPYFWTEIDSCDLHDCDGVAEADFFGSSPLKTLREQIDRLSSSDLQDQREILASTIA
jgi:lantibiotic modifying enzyme